MLKLRFLLVVFSVVTAASVMAEGTAPQFAADSKLELREIQWRQAKTVIQMKDLQEQYAALQKNLDADRALFDEKIKQAESKAGIDLSKYDVNIDTLVVSEKAKTEKK